MRIRTLRFANFGPFRGEHVLELGPGAYAVVARYEEDPLRSNLAGKSSVLEGIRFALDGGHRHRLEDGFISRGEASGGVGIVFDDGSSVDRSRVRGKRTELKFQAAPGASTATQDAAQELLTRRVGLSPADFEATALVGQKQAARLVLAKPEERMSVFGGWLDLGPLESCASDATTALAGKAGRLKLVEEQIGHLADRDIAVDWDAELAAAEASVEATQALFRKATADIAANAEAIEVARTTGELERVVEEGKKIRATLDEADLGATKLAHHGAVEATNEADFAWRSARAEHHRVRDVARGEFDGRCPVAGIACPATTAINEDSAAARKRLRAAEKTMSEADAKLAGALEEMRGLEAKVQAGERLEVRLEAFRETARRLRDRLREMAPRKKSAAVGESVLEDALAEVDKRLQDAFARRARAAEGKTRAEAARARLEELEAEAEGLRADVARYRALGAIFGRAGAQRRVAERAMSEIERGANGVLEACGCPFSVAVRWSREGQGLAKHCDACGQAFPASARAKACERCGAARGPNVTHQVDLELSDRSGAAEDLAGIGIQLSASAWLRRERGSAWSVALVDEPFSALDTANRRALGKHLASMLSGAYGFEQSLVVAHHSDVLDALPGRIEIVRGTDGWSSVRVA